MGLHPSARVSYQRWGDEGGGVEAPSECHRMPSGYTGINNCHLGVCIFFDTTPFIWKNLAFLVSFRKSMSIQNLNVFEANHLSGTSYVLFERYFFPRSFFVENFDVLSFLLYYTTPKQIGSNLLSAKSWVPTRNRWMCPECGAKKAPSIAWLFGGSFWWWNFGPGSKWLKPSIFLPGSGLFSEADEWMVTKVVYPPRKKTICSQSHQWRPSAYGSAMRKLQWSNHCRGGRATRQRVCVVKSMKPTTKQFGVQIYWDV